MPKVVHVIDQHAPLDSLWQMDALAGADGQGICFGPPPPAAMWSIATWGGRMRSVHCPLGSSQLAARKTPGLAAGADLLHVWSPGAWQAAWMAAREQDARPGSGEGQSCRLLLSLPCSPPSEQVRSYVAEMIGGNNHLSVPTSHARQAFLAAGAAADHVHILPPPAIVVADKDQRRHKVRAELGVAGDECLMLVLGEMTRHAGHRIAAWADAILRQMVPHVRLLLPGDGDYRRSVVHFANATGYGTEIFLTEDRLGPADCLAASDMALFLGDRDGGLAGIVSAMAAGLPVVASQLPEQMEAVGCGRAVTCQAGDPRQATAAILKLVDDRSAAGAVAAAGQQWAGQHADPRNVGDELQRIYRLCIQGPSDR